MSRCFSGGSYSCKDALESTEADGGLDQRCHAWDADLQAQGHDMPWRWWISRLLSLGHMAERNLFLGKSRKQHQSGFVLKLASTGQPWYFCNFLHIFTRYGHKLKIMPHFWQSSSLWRIGVEVFRNSWWILDRFAELTCCTTLHPTG